MKHLKILLIIFIFTSCTKEKVGKVHSDMENNWKHHKSATEVFWINISSNGKGNTELYISGELNHKSVTRNWFIKKGKLEFARISPVGNIFSIDQYPTVSPTHFVHEFDTITAGQKYIILDGHYFVGAN